MSVTTKTERVSARVSHQVYNTLLQAAEFTGATLNQFLVQSALERAKDIIEQERVIKLTSESAAVFFEAIENPSTPNKKLLDAVKAYKDAFSDAEN